MNDIQQFEFHGMLKWAQVRRPNKFGKYAVQFYPKDTATRKAIVATGIKSKMKEDDDGFYFTFTRTEKDFFQNDMGPPKLLILDDGVSHPLSEAIGNGSEGTVGLTVEKFYSKSNGDCVRGILDWIEVTKLVEYVPEDKPKPTPEREELPK